MIKTFNLTKKFGDTTAVQSLNLHIKKGEIFGFIGPNGAGKTTTIKMMVGILPPTQGRVEIAGIDNQQRPLETKRIIGYIPDDPYVYPQMTGREFLHFKAELFRAQDKEKKIKKLLKIFPIEKMIDGYFKDFSRGTKQKLSILAAFLHDPQILIIDEPILGLDPLSSKITENLLKKFSREGGTVFVSTHTLPVVQAICDRMGIIDEGKLIFEGTFTELKKRLKTQEVILEKLFLKITEDTPR